MLPYMVILFVAALSMPLTNGQAVQSRLISLLGSLDLGLSQVQMLNYRDVPVEGAEYDFIVVGGGPAGCVIANRLSENPNWNVYLIEAGGIEGVSHRVPLLAPYLQTTPTNWGYMSTPQENACLGMNDQVCALPRGKILGGGSSMNYMIYTRGNKHDFNGWAEAGAKGWSYEEVLPYFLKSEQASLDGLENSPYHNKTGPLSVEYVKFRTQFGATYLEAAKQAGHKEVDYNGETQMGVAYVQATTKNGRRHSSFSSYIEPIRKDRKNLHVITEAHVTRVLIDEETKTAKGVEVSYRNQKYNIFAKKEVILSAGTFHSPQILMLSGVGPADQLNKFDIPIIKELPVGKKFYDHFGHWGPTFVTNTTGQTVFASNARLTDVLNFASGKPDTAFSSIGTVEALTFFKSKSAKGPDDLPNIELITLAGGLASDEGEGLIPGSNFKREIYDKVYAPLVKNKTEHYTIVVMPFHQKSVGTLELSSSDPLDHVRINPNYLSNPDDVEELLEGIREAIRISKTPAMQKIGAKLLDTPIPGCEHLTFDSDDYWRCSIRHMTNTIYHHISTCSMGAESDPTAVVNEELKVIGIKNLRVADTSVIPLPPTAHTNALSFLVGEKGADMIRTQWSDQ